VLAAGTPSCPRDRRPLPLSQTRRAGRATRALRICPIRRTRYIEHALASDYWLRCRPGNGATAAWRDRPESSSVRHAAIGSRRSGSFQRDPRRRGLTLSVLFVPFPSSHRTPYNTIVLATAVVSRLTSTSSRYADELVLSLCREVAKGIG